MKKITKFLSRYLRFIWSGKTNFSNRTVDVDEANIVDIGEVNIQPPNNQEPSEKETKLRIITQINRLLITVCITSFIFIFIYSFIYPDKPIPDLMQNAFFTTLGWFGGLLGALFQVEQNK